MFQVINKTSKPLTYNEAKYYQNYLTTDLNFEHSSNRNFIAMN